MKGVVGRGGARASSWGAAGAGCLPRGAPGPGGRPGPWGGKERPAEGFERLWRLVAGPGRGSLGSPGPGEGLGEWGLRFPRQSGSSSAAVRSWTT